MSEVVPKINYSFIVNNHLNFIRVLLSEKLKIGFSFKGLDIFYEILDLSIVLIPDKNIYKRQNMLVNFFSSNYGCT